nr:hypothetical protein CFP56_69673 [Quercus suber]
MSGIAQWGEYTPSNTTANTSGTLLKSTPPTLPPPQTFDILPPLHELLARIDHVSTQNGLTANIDNDESQGTRYLEIQPLEPKDLPAEVLPLKSKIRKALRELENLPDMDRSIEDQREEIAELIQRQAAQEAMIKALSQAAQGMRTELASNVPTRRLSHTMSELFFGTPTHLAGLVPSYLRVMDEDMPILHLSSALEARGLDPGAEVDKMDAAIATLRAAANAFQKEVLSHASGRVVKASGLEVENMLLEKMAPLNRSRQAILNKLERLAADEQICVRQVFPNGALGSSFR